ncbi:hypothetical protein [Acidisoma sp. C75]
MTIPTNPVDLIPGLTLPKTGLAIIAGGSATHLPQILALTALHSATGHPFDDGPATRPLRTVLLTADPDQTQRTISALRCLIDLSGGCLLTTITATTLEDEEAATAAITTVARTRPELIVIPDEAYSRTAVPLLRLETLLRLRDANPGALVLTADRSFHPRYARAADAYLRARWHDGRCIITGPGAEVARFDVREMSRSAFITLPRLVAPKTDLQII